LLELTEGQASDYKGAHALVDKLPQATELLADRGYDADWFREALQEKGIEPCIPPKKNRKTQHHYNKELYKKRHIIENSFSKLKDWRRIATRYDRCAHTFRAAIIVAVIVIWWI
jgi:transposase